jgi:hypothetical protein
MPKVDEVQPDIDGGFGFIVRVWREAVARPLLRTTGPRRGRGCGPRDWGVQATAADRQQGQRGGNASVPART